jgi:HSP20 family protein
MATSYTDPFEALLGIQRALEQSYDSDWLGLGTSSRGAFPPVNVFQQGDDLVVIAETPGVKREDLDISIQRNQLRLSGKREIHYGDNISFHRRERDSGRFDRTFTLPLEIEADDVKAEYKDGLLALYLPRAEKDRPRRIEIA